MNCARGHTFVERSQAGCAACLRRDRAALVDALRLAEQDLDTTRAKLQKLEQEIGEVYNRLQEAHKLLGYET